MGVTIHDKDGVWFVDARRLAGSRDDFGGGGRSVGGYRRDPSDTADVDVSRVEELLEERAGLRASRDYEGADAVRDDLAKMGVAVYDREQTWVVDQRYGGGGGDRTRDFGPTGHDYKYVGLPEVGASQLLAINGLIAARLEAKLDRKFGEADSLLSQLGGMGVSLRDREKTWTCRPPKDFGPLGHDYERAADDDTPFDEATLAKINELLAQRLQAKLTRAFDEADGCMDELQAIGVFVNDKLRGWRADGGAFPTHARIEGDGDAAWPYADEAVLALLAERSIAKRDADYETADAISTKLRDEMCVALDDKRGTWRAVTLSGGHFRVGPRVESGLADKVASILERREPLRLAGDYDAADALQDELQELGITVDSRLRTWRLGAAPTRSGGRGGGRSGSSGRGRGRRGRGGESGSWRQR